MSCAATETPIHFVWKSDWAQGIHSFLNVHNKNFCEKTIHRWAKRYGVRIYRMAIARDHIHIVLRITNRPLYRSFIRVSTSQIASHVMRGESFQNFTAKVGAVNNRSVKNRPENEIAKTPIVKGKASETAKSYSKLHPKEQRFWQFRPFSRVMTWGRDFKATAGYLLQNTLEALGHIPYTPRRASRYAREILYPDSPGKVSRHVREILSKLETETS